MEWWIWIVLGFVLLMVEVIAFGDFYVFFFGVGAILIGILEALGLAGPAWSQWLLFSVISVVALFTLRRRLMETIQPSSRKIDNLVGETAKALEKMPGGKTGKVELRGSSWSAQNVGTETLAVGQRCRVERIDGLTLSVRADGGSE